MRATRPWNGTLCSRRVVDAAAETGQRVRVVRSEAGKVGVELVIGAGEREDGKGVFRECGNRRRRWRRGRRRRFSAERPPARSRRSIRRSRRHIADRSGDVTRNLLGHRLVARRFRGVGEPIAAGGRSPRYGENADDRRDDHGANYDHHDPATRYHRDQNRDAAQNVGEKCRHVADSKRSRLNA